MALYEYACDHCRESVDVSKPMADMDRAEACGSCGQGMDRVLHAPATAFVRGGTGAAQGSGSARTQARSNSVRSLGPTDKAAVQRENVYRESGLQISDAATKKIARELASA